jgi:serine protease Do
MNLRRHSLAVWCAFNLLAWNVSALESNPRRTAIVEAVAKTRSAIVSLSTIRNIPARFEDQDNNGRVRGLGTGVIIDPRGYVVTNYHVVEKVDEIQTRTFDGHEFAARVVSYDDRADLALVKMDASRELDYLPLWGAGEPILGETVIAIGNPYGLEGTISTGIVSAVGRQLRLPNGEVFNDLIQTDASINPGNSGGPLLSINGDLLGINIAIRSHAQGIGFAVPTAQVRKIVERMMTRPNQMMVHHGLHVEEVVPPEKSAGQRLVPVLRISQVEPDSAAYRQGFRKGDELVSVANQPVRVRFDLARIFWDRKSDESLVVLVRRNSQQIPIKVTLLPPREVTDGEVLWQHLGLEMQPVSAQRVRTVHSSLNGGLLILKVAPRSIADRVDFRPGDILIGLDEWATVEVGNVRWVMQWKELPQRLPISYVLIREGRRINGKISLPYLPESTEAETTRAAASR